MRNAVIQGGVFQGDVFRGAVFRGAVPELLEVTPQGTDQGGSLK